MAASGLDPAVGLLDLDSVAVGVLTGDAMVKAAPLGSIYAGTVHPGRYLILVSGDTASVEIALEVGRGTAGPSVLDSVLLPDIHPDVTAAIVTDSQHATADGEAVAVIETSTVATVIDAADAGVKAASVTIATICLADGLGGKGYVIFGGGLAEVEAAMERATERTEPTGALVNAVVVPQLAAEMRDNLARDLRFNSRVTMRAQERDG